MKLHYFIKILFLLASIAIIIIFNIDNFKSINVVYDSKVKDEVKVNKKEETPKIKKDKEISKIIPKILSEKDKNIIIDDAFYEISLDDANLVQPYRKKISPITSFKFKKGSFLKLKEGDTIILPEINGVEYSSKITKSSNFKKTVSFESELINEDKEFYAILTEGETSAFIKIKSPEGLYSVEIVNNIGYVYNSNEMSDKLIDFSKTDQLFPKK